MVSKHPGLIVMGGAEDKVDGCTHFLSDKDTFDLFGGKVKMTCYVTPCHTRGSTNFYLETDAQGEHECSYHGQYKIIKNVNKGIFTGDMAFIGGCGYFMEGTPAEMLDCMDLMLSLPEDTKLFPGHEYTLNNFKFIQKIHDKS